jgi:hypothetical protein
LEIPSPLVYSAASCMAEVNIAVTRMVDTEGDSVMKHRAMKTYTYMGFEVNSPKNCWPRNRLELNSELQSSVTLTSINKWFSICLSEACLRVWMCWRSGISDLDINRTLTVQLITVTKKVAWIVLLSVHSSSYYSSWMALQPLWALTSLQFPDLFYSQSARLLEWVISSSQVLYRNFGREMADNFAQRPPWDLRFFNVQ